MKRFLLAILCLAGVVLALYVSRELYGLRPWAKPGTVYFAGKWQFGDYEFQVWERKGVEVWEVADGLFVRHGTNEWQNYSLGHQDGFALRMELKHLNSISVVEVYSGGKHKGTLDLVTGNFRRSQDGQLLKPQSLGSGTNPPGLWWTSRTNYLN